MRLAPQPCRARRRRRSARRFQRGTAAIETVLSLIVLMFIVSAGLNFGHAMVVRHRLTTATSRAVRICALVEPANAEACVAQQLAAGLGATAGACASLEVAANAQALQGVEVLGVSATCDYAGGPWGAFLATQMADSPLILRANSVMPRR